MTTSDEDCNARRRAIYAERRGVINTRKREIYLNGYKEVLSRVGKDRRVECPICGKQRRADYMKRHILVKHP